MGRAPIFLMLSLLGMLCATPIVYAGPVNPELTDLCEYDNFCMRLQNSDGSFIQPKAGLVKVFEQLRGPVRVTAHELGIDPRALVGGILAENSMNIAVDDDIHNFLEQIKANPLANTLSKIIRGKSFSLGLGQIKPEAAFAAESILARIEHRSRRTPREITDMLMTPIGSLTYAGAIIRTCQDAYEARGMSVKGKPEILATLYNLGDCETRARNSAETGKPPRPNFFGIFVRHYLNDLGNIVQISRPYSDSEDRELKQDPSTKPSSHLTQRKTITSKISLVANPPQCTTGAGGNSDEYEKTRTLQRGEVLAAVDRGDYEILSNSLGCELEDWTLIRSAHGEIGWVQSDVLNANSKDRVQSSWGPDAAPACDTAAAEKCRQQVKQIAPGKDLGQNAGKLLQVPMVGNKNHTDDPHFRNFNGSCLRGGSDAGSRYNEQKVIDAAAAKDLLARFEVKKSEIVKAMGYSSWDDPKNLFASDLDNYYYSMSNNCSVACKGDVKGLEQILGMDFTKFNGYKGYLRFKGITLVNNSYFNRASPEELVPITDSSSRKQAVKDYFDNLEKQCAIGLKKFPEFASLEADVRRDFEDDLRDQSWFPQFFQKDSSDDPVTTCRVLHLFDGYKPCTKVFGFGCSETEAQTCQNCSISIEARVGGSSSTTPISAINAQRLLTEDDDIADVLKNDLTRLRSKLPQSTDSDQSANCRYDPTATAERVKKLIKLDCIEAAFVPDMYIVNKLSNSTKVIYKNFSDDDRFELSIKSSCAAKGSP